VDAALGWEKGIGNNPRARDFQKGATFAQKGVGFAQNSLGFRKIVAAFGRAFGSETNNNIYDTFSFKSFSYIL